RELNMRQRRWLELLKDYDTNIQYHPGKANVVVDALSRKLGMIAGIMVEEEIIRDLERLDIEFYVRRQHGYLASLRHFWWSGMKGDVATFVSKCLICQQVKIKHQWASGLLQQLDILVWKWDEISMDFVTGLTRTQRRHDAIWVVVDRLTKSAHFLPIRKDYSVSRLAEIFQQEIVRLHGTPSTIVGERVIEGPEMIEVTNAKVIVAKEKHKEARTRQKSYADKHRKSLEFQPGDHVFLKVSLARGVRRFGIKGKLSPRFIGPFEILDRVGEIHTDLSYVEEPEAILDRQDRVMRKKTIPFVKILWRNHPEREATWETEESIQTSYPHFLP
nr:hypothetical protein [Tanacetum cinerariifolium]